MTSHKNYAMGALLMGALSCHGAAFAVDKFSRSCRFDKIPSALQYVSAKFLVRMGADESKGDIYRADAETKASHWIQESLTTDYFQVRYYLFATARRYSWEHIVNDAGKVVWGWKFQKRWDSKWSAEEVLANIRTDPTFSPYYANRGPTPFYNARAGEPTIYTVYTGAIDPSVFMVVGRHYYYNPQSRAMVDFGETRSQDCNLGNFGQYGIFDR